MKMQDFCNDPAGPRMESSVAAREEHGSVVIHCKAFHAPRGAGGTEPSCLKNSSILRFGRAFRICPDLSPQLTISEH
jgi:hypothetical protein